MAAYYNTNSENVYVFPVANRPKYDPAGRLTTEYNLTSILNRLLDKKSFVVTQKDNNTPIASEDKEFEFNINGYFFHIVDINNLINNLIGTGQNKLNPRNGDVIRAEITLQGAGGEGDSDYLKAYKNQVLQSIYNGDKEDNNQWFYKGISFNLCRYNTIEEEWGIVDSLDNLSYDDTSNSNNFYTLNILEYRDSNFYIPEQSKIKFETNATGAHRSVIIDDGVLYGEAPSASQE